MCYLGTPTGACRRLQLRLQRRAGVHERRGRCGEDDRSALLDLCGCRWRRVSVRLPQRTARGSRGICTEERRERHALKMTLSPSFHISVTSVSPGYTTPANLISRAAG